MERSYGMNICITRPLRPDAVPGAGAVAVSRAGQVPAPFPHSGGPAVGGAAASLPVIHIDTEMKGLVAQARRQVTQGGWVGREGLEER